MTISKKQSAAGGLSRRNFLKGTGLAGVGGVALGAGMLADINVSKGVKAAEGEPIPIGGGVPLTGWAAADGIEFKRALEMACEEINAMGGILGRPLVMANFTHYFIASLVSLRPALASGRPGPIGVAAIFGVFAVAYGSLLFARTPAAGKAAADCEEIEL